MRVESDAAAASPALRRSPNPLDQAIARGAHYLLAQQDPQGYWVGELEADTTLESDYILYQLWLDFPNPEKVQEAARYIRQRQTPSGGWNIYHGGPDDVSASVKAYFALKLAGECSVPLPGPFQGLGNPAKADRGY